jgi:nucleoside 2-deoxyribosyltransferase
MRIYLASSWRNERHSEVLEQLRVAGFEVYDFKDPAGAFHWSDIDPDWQDWTPEEFIEGLEHPLAVEGFNRDFGAMQDCDVCVLLLPCGRSAHLEAGWFIGRGKQVVILLADGEPELMYSMSTHVATTVSEVIGFLATAKRNLAAPKGTHP